MPKNNIKGKVLYQIYPRSFFDSNSDGIGDLAGIVEKLDYLAGAPGSLGVDAIWLSPVYQSPMADFGYDVSDHCAVDPMYGTMADFEHLIRQAHARNLQVIIDLVLNHTSDRHKWFIESRSSRANPKRDWYVWADPGQNGSPPNNWKSVFGGSAWAYDQQTGQYYLHTFLKQQPDLNWRNPAVRKAIRKIMRFWLNKGIDGFRLDAVYWLSKDRLLRDDPTNFGYRSNSANPYDSLRHTNSRHGPHLFSYLSELVDVVKTYDNRFLIAETSAETQPFYKEYFEFYQKVSSGNFAPFNFDLIHLPWNARKYQAAIDGFMSGLHRKDIPVFAMGSHDVSRLATRVGRRAAHAAAVLLLTLPGVVCVYNGDELGMLDAFLPGKKTKDPFEKNLPGLSLGRDPERTPIQWSPRLHAGFSRVKPWLPISRNFRSINVETERRDSRSLLNLYKALIDFRHHSLALSEGNYEAVSTTNRHLLAFKRTYKEESLCTMINFASKRFARPPCKGTTLYSTIARPNPHWLRPNEGRIVRVL